MSRGRTDPTTAGASRGPAILVVSAAPDNRRSTQELRRWVQRLRSRGDARCELWFLRDFHGWAGSDSRVVDALRTWPLARALEGVGLKRLAAGLRGRRLRRWIAQLDPGLVVFNDGLGERVLEGTGINAARLVRLNPEKPVDAELEAEGPHAFDGVLSAGFADASGGSIPIQGLARVRERTFEPAGDASSADVDALRAHRVELGVPQDVPLVVGWGEDAWIDGPDVFIRALWALERRHGIAAHGLWIAPKGLDQEEARLRSEATRCGVEDRYHRSDRYRVAETAGERGSPRFRSKACGDAVLLPYRAPTDAFDVLDVLCSGLGVVTFGSIFIEDPQLRVVDYLDVDSAAAQLADLLGQDRSVELVAARHRLRLDDMIEELIGIARARRVEA